MATDTTTMAFVPSSLTGQNHQQHARTAFVSSSTSSSSSPSSSKTYLYSTMADAGVPATKTSESDAATSNNQDAEVTVPTNLPSDVGFDYVPLATCLATGQWAEADQVCDVVLYTAIRRITVLLNSVFLTLFSNFYST
jgi:hypothetical protein